MDKTEIKTVVIWLDDVRDPFENDGEWQNFAPIRASEVIWVKTYYEFVEWIEKNGLPDGIAFDHDLADVEEWVDVIGYDGIYLVSNYGRIKRKKVSKGTSGGILIPDKSVSGLYVTLRNLGDDKKQLVHRIVLSSFKGIDPIRKYVNHKNGNRWDNRLSNLEWCTNSENVKHSYDFLERNFTAYGENHKNSKIISQYDKENQLLNVFGSVNEAGRQLGINFSNIAKAGRGERNSAGGFIWRYEDLEPTINCEVEHIKLTDEDFINKFEIIEEEKTGMDCAKWLVDYCLDNDEKLPLFSSQSANPPGRDNILSLLTNFKKSQDEN